MLKKYTKLTRFWLSTLAVSALSFLLAPVIKDNLEYTNILPFIPVAHADTPSSDSQPSDDDGDCP